MNSKIIVVFGIATLFTTNTQADSEKLTNPSNGHEYQRYDTPTKWHEAFINCSNKNAYLATITNQEENAWLNDNLIRQHAVWLGGAHFTDSTLHFNWVWITGEPFDHLDWLPQQPNVINCDRFVQYGLGYSVADGWNDWDGSAAIGYVCEWEHVGSPDLYTCLCPQPDMYSEAQPGHLRQGANGRTFGFAWGRGVVPKPRWPAARAADRRSRQAPMGAGEVQTAPRGGDAGVAQARSTRGQSGARRTPDAEWTRQSPDPTRT